MAITIEELILTARSMLTELPESVVFSRDNLMDLVKPAIALWQEQTNNDPDRRQNFIVESAAITLTSGIAELAAEIDAKGYRLQFIKDSDVVIAFTPTQEPAFKVKFVNSLNRFRMVGRQDRFFHIAYLSGTRLTIREAGEVAVGTLSGSITIRSAVIPTNLADLNKPVMYEIATVVADLAKKQFREQNRGLDIPIK